MRQPIQQPVRLLMANRKPIYTFDIGNQVRELWYKSEAIFKHLLFKFYGIKPIGLPTKFHNRFSKIRTAHQKATSQRSYEQLKSNVGQLRAANHVRNLPKRWPHIDRLVGSSSNAPLYLKKWRRTFRSDLTSIALIGLTVQSASEEEVQWHKLSNLLKRLVNETHKTRRSSLPNNDELFKLDNILFERYIGKGCNAAIYEARLKDAQGMFKNEKLAIKMLFNYDAESNADAIYRSMNRECIPFNGSFGSEIDQLTGKLGRTKLPAHPNIVTMYGVLVDQIPELPRARELFKNALPPRLHEHGYGRNMTLFLVMKRYHINLRDYLKFNRPTAEQSLSLLTQLFNGVEHLVRNNVTHRDLKSDNILLEIDLEQNVNLVITDFGYATQLSVHYTSDDVCLGGNAALRAPEIITAVPGLFSRLDYSKSDLWASGAIAYEMFNHRNPFYAPTKNSKMPYLNSATYKEDDLSEFTPFHMPVSVQKLVRQILNRDPFRRPEVEVCSTMCALLMFCNELSLKCIANSRLEEKELMRKINLLLSDTLFFARKKLNKVQLKIKLMFLMNLDIENVKEALKYFEI